MILNPGYYSESDLKNVGFRMLGNNVAISKNSTFIGVENISIGNNVRIDGNVTFAVASGHIKVGNYIHIGGSSHINGSGGVDILNFCTISQGVRIYSASDDYSGESYTNPTIPLHLRNLNIARVVLNEHVIIGSGSVVLPGVELGQGAAVGALSLVNSDLLPWSVYAGSPIKKLNDRSKNLLKLNWECVD
jgi:acetyltransferase-like isoleucine patch superfamily enzyme